MAGFFNSNSWAADKALPTLPKCGACGLYKNCISPKMAVTGRGKRSILFVGEAPGETEDRQGKQFIGDAGQCLRKMLRSLDVDLDDCWITNAAVCRPPGNKIDDLYIESCRPNLTNAIAELRPKVVVLLGMSAVKSMIGLEWGNDLGQLGRWVGWHIPSPTFNTWICPSYHPSFVMRTNEDPALVKITKTHLEKALFLEESGMRPDPKPLDKLRLLVDVIKHPEQSFQRLTGLAEKEGTIAFDYETTGLKPELPEHEIVTAAFCLNGEDVFACVIDKHCHEPLSRILRKPELKKVAQNMKFEERWTRAKLGHPVVGWEWDTMLATHILDNRGGVTGLKFQSYVQFGIGDYDSSIRPFLESPTTNGLNHIRQAPLQELLTYNGMDAILEYKLAERQRENLH